MTDEAILEIEEANVGKVIKDALIKQYTTYKCGGRCRAIVFPRDISSLVTLIKIINKDKIKYKIIGNGSNMLFSDELYDGILIKLTDFNDIEFMGTKVRVGAGFPLTRLSILAAKHSLTGLEFASGIPGTVGGAVYMNAGAYKSDMGYVIQSVKVLTPELQIITLENKELDFHYRTSYLQKHPDYICLEAMIKLEKGKREAIEEVIETRRKRRLETQPLEYPSAGSVFRNPEGMYAGELIEKLGLKGKKIGGAEVSTKHANFIINSNNASSKDIHDLICYVHDEVKKEYNIDLKIEQEFVNWE
jgi:UDP-N-acetylmuramate dehydrogenase